MRVRKAAFLSVIGLLVCASFTSAGPATAKQRAAVKERLDRLMAQYMKGVRFWSGMQLDGWCAVYSARTRLPMVGPRCRECDPGTVTLSGKGGTEETACALLMAYEATGEPQLLDMARKVGDYLIKAQFPDGHWSAISILVDGRVVPSHTHGLGRYVGLEDGVQEAPIYALLWLYRLTKAPKYLQAAAKGGEIMLAAQNPNGSFPQYWDPLTKKPRGYGYGVINDAASTEPVRVFKVLYMATKDEKWLKPIPKVGDWLVSAYVKGKAISGWAEQYDKNNKPCKARPFEPPMWCRGATMQAISGLFEVHAITRDEKYLKPIRDVLPVLERTMTKEGKHKGWYYYVDWNTGKPVFVTRGGKIVSDPSKAPGWTRKPFPGIPLRRVRDRLKGWDEKRAVSFVSFRGSYVPSLPGPNDARGDLLKHHVDRLEKELKGRTPDGYTVRKHPDGDRISPLYDLAGAAGRTAKILQSIAICQGKLPPHYGALSRFTHHRVWPDGDWYNTPIRVDGKFQPKAQARTFQPRLTFHCDFENATADADFSLGPPGQNGRDWQHVPGRSGKGLLFDKPDAYARYAGLRNVPVEKGSVSLWVRSKPGTNIWNDSRDHYVLVLQTRQFLHPDKEPRSRFQLANNQLWLVKRGKGNLLEFSLQLGMHDSRKCQGIVTAPVGDLIPTKWHRLQASWDNAGKRISLSVNNAKPKVAAVKAKVAPREWVLFYVGNSHIYRVKKPLNGIVDDLGFSTRVLF